jgi:hypothetical protein
MAQATQLQFSGLTVLANAAPPSTANMMIGGFGGMGMFTVQSSAEYVLMAPNAGRFTVRGAGAVNPQTGRASAQLAPYVITVQRAGAPGAAQPAQPAQPMMQGFPPGMFPSGMFPPGMMAPDQQPQAPPVTVNDPDAPPPGEIGSAQYNPTGFVRLAVDNATPYVTCSASRSSRASGTSSSSTEARSAARASGSRRRWADEQCPRVSCARSRSTPRAPAVRRSARRR